MFDIFFFELAEYTHQLIIIVIIILYKLSENKKIHSQHRTPTKWNTIDWSDTNDTNITTEKKKKTFKNCK